MLRPTVSRPDLDYCLTVAGLLIWEPSLTRRVCRLQLLLALASAVIFGSESRRTRGHILLSQIWDFPFRRLLRLAGSRWRYSTPPPHGYKLHDNLNCSYITSSCIAMEYWRNAQLSASEDEIYSMELLLLSDVCSFCYEITNLSYFRFQRRIWEYSRRARQHPTICLQIFV
jgi:hypothetical protein